MKRDVIIRGKRVVFSSRVLKSGETAYYRDGKRARSYYQKRLARGVLTGQTVSEARGHPFGAYSGKLLSRRDIAKEEEFHLDAWAETPLNDARGKERATYFMKVSVKSQSMRERGSPTGNEEDACTPATLQLKDPDSNTQRGFTYTQVARNFERIALYTLAQYRLGLCSDSLRNDLIAIWRHTRR